MRREHRLADQIAQLRRTTMSDSEFRVRLINRVAIMEIACWPLHEDPTWRGADYQPQDFQNPAQGYFTVGDRRGSILAIGATGLDAQIPGGDYAFGAPRIVDIALWLRPTLRAESIQRAVASATCEWLVEEHQPRYLRSTVLTDDVQRKALLAALDFAPQAEFKAQSEDTTYVVEQWLRRI